MATAPLLRRRLLLPTLTVALSRRLCAAALRVDTGVVSLPDPAKVRGEDAHIVTRGTDTRVWGGVFDGVGGWSRHGIDPSRYSRELARLVDVALLKECGTSGSPELLPALKVAHEKNVEIGTCTACLALVETDTGHVTTLNVGDSAVWLLRPAASTKAAGTFEVVHRSEVQQHAFNTPYQLGTQSGDMPADGQMERVEARPGDMLILGTDGLFDNMSEETILAKVQDGLHAQPAQEIAKSLAAQAQELSFDENHASPFQLEAARHGLNFKGGKIDDITVVVLKLFAEA